MNAKPVPKGLVQVRLYRGRKVHLFRESEWNAQHRFTLCHEDLAVGADWHAEPQIGRPWCLACRRKADAALTAEGDEGRGRG